MEWNGLESLKVSLLCVPPLFTDKHFIRLTNNKVRF